VLGDRVDPRYYNSVLLEGWADFRLGDLVQPQGEESYFVLRPERRGHPIFQGFPVGPGQNLSQAHFRKAVECVPGGAAQVLASFSNGLPALVESQGLLLFTSSFDAKWSNFPMGGAFLPLVHKSLFYLIRREEGRGKGLRAGEPLRLTVDPRRLGKGRIVCTGPEGLVLPVEERQSGEGSVLVTEPLPYPGIYTVRVMGGDVLARVAVNLDTNESDLFPMSEQQAATLYGEQARLLEGEEKIDRRLLEARFGRELWRQLLVLVFLLLLAESLLARGKLAP